MTDGVKKRPHSEVRDDSFSSIPDEDDDLNTLDTRALLRRVLSDNKAIKQAHAELELRFADLIKQNATLIAQCTLLNAENQVLLAENKTLKLSFPISSTSLPSTAIPQDQPSSVPEIVKLSSRVKLSREVASMNQKSYLAVVERLDDSKDKKQDDSDKSFINDVCIEAELPCPIEVFRHECDSKRRPLKINACRIHLGHFVHSPPHSFPPSVVNLILILLIYFLPPERMVWTWLSPS
ncbi:unnamed protein product [Caenorhabditis auriculariae]|uniref:Uncharacterized protein n=1 Tax=Caenorhabditis auriculariae TaxID=2777116 RepID=A0A8S1H542_9PELO|nr:unnamed protein product [Caenorhabditis auriculariae]